MVHPTDFFTRIYLSALHLSNLSSSCMTVLDGPMEQLMLYTPLSQMPEVQSVNSTGQTPKVNQSAWSSYRLVRQLLDDVIQEREKITPSIESKTPEACSTGSRRRRAGREEQEVQVRAKIVAMAADVMVEAETLHLGTGEATSANPLRTGLTATCPGRATADLPADTDTDEEKVERGGLAREGNEAESEAARTEETVMVIDW